MSKDVKRCQMKIWCGNGDFTVLLLTIRRFHSLSKMSLIIDEIPSIFLSTISEQKLSVLTEYLLLYVFLFLFERNFLLTFPDANFCSSLINNVNYHSFVRSFGFFFLIKMTTTTTSEYVYSSVVATDPIYVRLFRIVLHFRSIINFILVRFFAWFWVELTDAVIWKVSGWEFTKLLTQIHKMFCNF